MGTTNTTLKILRNTLNAFCIFNCIPCVINVFFWKWGPRLFKSISLKNWKIINHSNRRSIPGPQSLHYIPTQHRKPILVSAPKCVNPYRPYNPHTIFIRHKFNHCLFMSVTHWVSFCSFFILFKLDLSKLLNVILLLLNRFVNIDTWISLSCYRNLSKLIV